MKSFSTFINEESGYRRKGWVNIKSGKMILWPFRGRTIRPFHDEYVANNPKKFFTGGESALLRKFADMNGFEPEDMETQSMWRDIKSGKVDRDPNLDSIMSMAGWFRVVFDEGISSLESETKREGQMIARIIQKNVPWSKIDSLYVYDEGILDDPIELYSEDDLESYIKTGRKAKRTNIGRTMAMFRGESVEIDRDEFRAHWKKAPILKTGGGDVKQRNAFWDSYFQHFEDKYGEIPKRVKDAMRMADYKPNPSITYKGKKFSMRTGMDEMDLLYNVLSESVINEAKMRGLYFKGWMTPRGRVVMHSTTATGTSKYHIQILTDLFPFEKMRPHMGEWVGAKHLKFLQKMKKDGIADFTDDQVKDLIEKQYKAIYKQWATGKIDSDRGVEEKFQKMGWVKIWVDRNQYGMSMIQGNDKRKVLDCAKKLDKKFGGWDGFMTKSMSISIQNDIGARIGTAIRDSAGWDHYLRTGEVRRHQTEIGRKMAMFREWREHYNAETG